MELYKLIVLNGNERITDELHNVVFGFQSAVSQAMYLRDQYCEDYPNIRIACFDFEEDNIDNPSNDYIVYERDKDGEYTWNNIGVECDNEEDFDNE